MKMFNVAIKAFFHLAVVIWLLPPFCQYLVDDEPGIAFFILWLFFACMVGIFLGYSKEGDDGRKSKKPQKGY